MTETWKQWQGLVVDGKFRLHKYLGGSDRSAVFLTEWGEPNAQPAAIKLISADPESAERHLSRWKLAMKLSHPHLLPLFQVGRYELDGAKLLYVLMEYAEEELSQILLESPLTPTETREMISAVLEALSYLHSQGLVHGQLKPANIMAIGNELKICSDAIGKAGGCAEYASLYDPPEAVSGACLPSADVWSLGMTLVEALTQHPPSGKPTEEGRLVLQTTLPAPFQEVADHCLCLDPEHRWTVANIQAHLSLCQVEAAESDALQQSSQTIAPEAAAIRTPSKSRMHYMAAALTAGVTLATLVVLFTMPGRHARPLQDRGGVSSPSGTQEQPRQALGLPEHRQLAASKDSALVPARPGAVSGALASNFVPGAVIQRVRPHVSRTARRTIHGSVKIKVKVAVDPSGSVAGVTLDSPESRDYFTDMAIEAARHWRFTPAQVNGQNVASEWILGFEFGRGRTRIRPSPLLATDQHL